MLGSERGWLGADELQRALTMMDRRPGSATYGCCDRPFWHYRTLTDFPGSTWQQIGWGLAQCAIRRDNLSGNDELAESAIAAYAWWARIQKSDGSFDEWYRNERSYCPTAFAVAGAIETLHLLSDSVDPHRRDAILAAALRGGAWLERRWNPTVMNQNLAAALAFLSLSRYTREERWEKAAERTYARLAAEQHQEGWFPEYSGADFGYSTLALDLLALADRRGAAPALELARRLAGFLWRVKGAGPGYPGRLGSRGTSHLFPFGALHFSDAIPAAAALAQAWTNEHRTGLTPNPRTVDDRYFAYFYFPAFALAQGCLAPNNRPAPERAALDCLPGAGFVVSRQADRSVTISTHLGGAVALEQVGSAPRYLLGYEINSGGARKWSTASWNCSPKLTGVVEAEDGLSIDCEGAAVRDGQPLVHYAIPFHIVTRLLGMGRIASLFQRSVKHLMISPRRSGGLRLQRRISLPDGGFTVADRITCLTPTPVCLRASADIAVHSPSAMNDLADSGLVKAVNRSLGKADSREREFLVAIAFSAAASSTEIVNVTGLTRPASALDDERPEPLAGSPE